MRARTPRSPRTSAARKAAVKAGFRSAFEQSIDQQLRDAGVDYEYEKKRYEYIQHATRHYRPDFELLENGIIIESKGMFTAADRTKHLLVRQQHPELDIRFVFQRSSTRLNKTSKTTYGDWATKHGFLYADTHIPAAWLAEQRSAPK